MSIHKQYNAIRETIPSSFVLFFQIGDFFELFDEDAKKVHHAIGITLTSRGDRPMCGIPCRNIDFYKQTLILKHGIYVAICTQNNDIFDKKLIHREITELVTPGVIYDTYKSNLRYFMSIYLKNEKYEVIYTESSTYYTHHSYLESLVSLKDLISKVNPVEIISNMSRFDTHIPYNLINRNIDKANIREKIKGNLNINCVNAIHLMKQAMNIRGIFWEPVYETKNLDNCMKLGASTITNLEIFESYNGDKANSLFFYINNTQTAMGARRMEKMILEPLIDSVYLRQFHNSIEKIMRLQQSNRYTKRSWKIIDLERSLCKIMSNKSYIYQAKNLISFLQNVLKSIDIMQNNQSFLPQHLAIGMSESFIDDIRKLLNLFLDKNLKIGEGIFQNINKNILDLVNRKNSLMKDIEKMIANLTDNRGKFYRHNLLGCVIRVSQKYTFDNLISRKNTKIHRFYTSYDFMKLEKELISIEEDLMILENQELGIIHKRIKSHQTQFNNLFNLIGYLDFLFTCSENAIKYELIKPEILEEKCFEVKGGRHILIQDPIYNNILMKNDKFQCLITGPNMGGKSTYLRQNAIIVLLAQAGMYVPAQSLNMSVISGLFVRMGARDDFFSQQSTFFLEMKECAEFLREADENSMIIMDEVGRGTSWKDGIEISSSICHYISQHLQCFALISTHYLRLPKYLKNLNTFIYKQVNILFDNNNDPVLSFQMVEGIAKSSLGKNTAILAGIPKKILTLI